MKLTKKQREIMKQDIIDLGYLVEKYSKEKKFAKASECLKEMEQLQKKLRRDNEKED
jgi:hypothetical protein